jgi:hypothetical protein
MHEPGKPLRLAASGFGLRASGFRLPVRDRILTASAPGMAAAYPTHRQPAPVRRPVHAQGVQRVFGAARREAAAPQRPEKECLGRRQHPTIEAHAGHQNMLNRIHSGLLAAHFNNLALRRVVKKSRSTWAKPLPTIDGRATRTKSTGTAKSCWCRRKLSRSSRRARLRTTAPPIRPAVITPRREDVSVGNRCQLAIRHPTTSRSPLWRTRRKSRPCLMRAARANRRRGGAGLPPGTTLQLIGFGRPSAPVPGSDRGQPLAPHAPPVAQNPAAALARTPVQEPVLPFAANLGRLILSFHKSLHYVTRDFAFPT